ncbi:MAG TPA: hypothetical protein VGO00_28300, partial [Kofleriaceae bacterium]|nr:hypothetical protein [Kofleriaceae bacterium]
MVGGSGTGTIAATPSTLACNSGICSAAFPRGTQVKLTANPTMGQFLGWSDACHGTDSCTITMDRPQSVGALFGMPGEALWVSQLGGPGSDAGQAIATDHDNNIIVVGAFGQTMRAGTLNLTSNGMQDFFVAKLDGATGAVVWAKSFG